MGNYRCYNCNQEFTFLRGLEKHSVYGKCPSITKEMHEESLKPFFRVLTQVVYIDPKKLLNREKFLYSLKVDTYYPYTDLYKKLQEYAVKISHSISAKSGFDASKMIDGVEAVSNRRTD